MEKLFMQLCESKTKVFVIDKAAYRRRKQIQSYRAKIEQAEMANDALNPTTVLIAS